MTGIERNWVVGNFKSSKTRLPLSEIQASLETRLIKTSWNRISCKVSRDKGKQATLVNQESRNRIIMEIEIEIPHKMDSSSNSFRKGKLFRSSSRWSSVVTLQGIRVLIMGLKVHIILLIMLVNDFNSDFEIYYNFLNFIIILISII